MNTYDFADIYIGLSHVFSINITEKMMNDFYNISSDKNPLHIDKTYAQSKGFNNKVVYGMLVASFYSTLVGVYLPGEKALLQSISIDFCRPCYIDDALTVSGIVTEINSTVCQIVIKAEIKNEKGEKISRAKIKVGMFDEK